MAVINQLGTRLEESYYEGLDREEDGWEHDGQELVLGVSFLKELLFGSPGSFCSGPLRASKGGITAGTSRSGPKALPKKGCITSSRMASSA